MNHDPPSGDRAGISVRAVEIVVALLLIAFGGTVVYDSVRLGASWGSDGPQSGYFPFYIGALICVSALAIIAQVLIGEWKAREGGFAGAVARKRRQFVAWPELRQVLSVLLPALVYVLCVQLVGIYVASAVYIAAFMLWLGEYGWTRSVVVGVAVATCAFLLFEVWFKVPLYKGLVNPLFWTGY
jgi:hypothetical protein